MAATECGSAFRRSNRISAHKAGLKVVGPSLGTNYSWDSRIGRIQLTTWLSFSKVVILTNYVATVPSSSTPLNSSSTPAANTATSACCPQQPHQVPKSASKSPANQQNNNFLDSPTCPCRPSFLWGWPLARFKATTGEKVGTVVLLTTRSTGMRVSPYNPLRHSADQT